MRTTIDIPDATYRRLKVRAAQEGRSTRALILHAVERALDRTAAPSSKRVTLPLVQSRRPGTLRLTNEQIYDVISLP